MVNTIVHLTVSFLKIIASDKHICMYGKGQKKFEHYYIRIH